MELGLEKLPWYGQIAVFLAVALTGLVVFQMYWVQPGDVENETRRLQLNQSRLRIAGSLAAASRLPGYQAEVVELESRIEDLRAVLPERPDASQLMRRLQEFAAQTGLSIRAFTPREVEAREAYSAWPVRLELLGTYHALGLFFDRVGASSQVVTISDLSIEAMDSPESNATIRVACTATTYVLNEAPADAAPEPAA